MVKHAPKSSTAYSYLRKHLSCHLQLGGLQCLVHVLYLALAEKCSAKAEDFCENVEGDAVEMPSAGLCVELVSGLVFDLGCVLCRGQMPAGLRKR